MKRMVFFLAATATVAALIAAPQSATAQTTRDPWRSPFAADSIWNTSLGSNATYVAANLQNAALSGPEGEWLIRTGPTDPYRQTFYPGNDTQRIRANGTTETWIGWMRVPNSLIIPDVVGEPGQFGYSAPNNGAAFLEENGYSIIHLQPATRIANDGPIWGYPQRDYGEANGGNLFGPGRWGAHYGSGLSVIGGSIRVGELTASNRDSIRHVLKVLLWMGKYSQYTTSGDGNAGWRWPARQADSYANPAQYSYGYGTVNGGANASANIEQGTLFAIDKTANIDSLGLTTEKAKKIAWALQNYGAYLVDDNAQDSYSIGIEQAAINDFDISLADMNTLFRNLKVVTNNTPTTVGGGGTRRVAAAPQFAYGGSAVGVYTPLPGRMEAENYDVGGSGTVYSDTDATNNGGAYRVDGVDIENCGEGGYNVGWLNAGEWIGYSVNAPTGGAYNVTFRYAGFGGAVRINAADGTNLTGTVTLPSTGGYQAWQSKTVPLTLPSGNQTLYFNVETSGFNLNYMDFAKVSSLTNRATGGTATASSNPIAAENAPKAFDGNTGTKWLGTVGTGTVKAWLQYQFAGTTAYAVKEYSVTSANDAPERDPKNWNFQGSNDGTSWTTLNTQSNQTFANRFQAKNYAITNTTAYKYYRLSVTASNGSTDYTQVAEMQLLSQ